MLNSGMINLLTEKNQEHTSNIITVTKSNTVLQIKDVDFYQLGLEQIQDTLRVLTQYNIQSTCMKRTYINRLSKFDVCE